MLSLDDLVQNKDSTGEVQMCSTRDILTDKHPPTNRPDYGSLLPNDPEPVNPIAFNNLNADTIHQAALRTHVQLVCLD